tara:strand:- start:3789 stop:4310 length:522 start_codon:yes stop_codon:yes gene_type:complete
MASKANTHRSWGRTRSPKAMVDHVPMGDTNGDGTATFAEIARSVNAVDVLDSDASQYPANALNSATAGGNGYVTENQRYLHVHVKGSHAANTRNKNVRIFVYHYASQVWSALMVHNGNGSYVPAVASTRDDPNIDEQAATYIFEIAGADRVAFVGDTAGSNVIPTVYAACSTF